MEHPDRPHALTQQELVRLEDFLQSKPCGEGSMSLSRTHGFLTAVVSGPETFEPDEWIRLIFDEEVLDDSGQVQDVLGLILRLHQSIERTIPRKGEFSPILQFVQRSDGSLAYEAEEWCQGYISAMALWDRPTPGRVAALLEPVFLITRPGSAEERQFRDAHYDQLCAMLPRAAEAVYAHWHAGG